MAAGLGFKDFVTGEVLTATDVDGYLMQGVWVFASAAARTSAVTSPQEGNMSYLKDTNSTEYYSGSAWVAIGGSSGLPTAVFTDLKSSGTASGTFTQDAWRTRTINTTGFNNITSASLASNQITLPAGTYLVAAMGQVALVDVHKMRFYNITDSSVAITGTSNYNITSYQYQGTADLIGAFTITASKVFELQHYAKQTVSSNGFGVASTITSTDEVYAIVSITKVA
jgi:hypothetical protein